MHDIAEQNKTVLQKHCSASAVRVRQPFDWLGANHAVCCMVDEDVALHLTRSGHGNN